MDSIWWNWFSVLVFFGLVFRLVSSGLENVIRLLCVCNVSCIVVKLLCLIIVSVLLVRCLCNVL